MLINSSLQSYVKEKTKIHYRENKITEVTNYKNTS